LPEILEYLKRLEQKIYTAGPKKVKPPTEPEPFNLKTQSMPRKILLPEKVIFLK
jgi:hypothetical protein